VYEIIASDGGRMPTYVLLTGAKANVGDHLIISRAKQLLEKHIPNIRFIELPRWKPLNQRLSEVNSSQGVILCGGPAYQPHLYPGIYPLVEDLEKIKVPIIPFGLGWKGFPGDERTVREYRFSASSLKLLKRVHQDCQFTSCRDYLTKRVLERHGFTNVIMTGDPAWYDLQHLEDAFAPPQEIRVIALSVSAGAMYDDQCVDLANHLKKAFPVAKIMCAFHHGWEETEYVPLGFARKLNALRERLLANGFEVVNLAGDLQRMKRVYDDADIHVGYRLHAHLYFLSQRKPSFLLEEDGRGRGASEALGLRGVPAWVRTASDCFLAELPIGTRLRPVTRRILKAGIKPCANAVKEVIAMVQEEIAYELPHFQGVHKTIAQYYYKALVPFLEAFPGRQAGRSKLTPGEGASHRE